MKILVIGLTSSSLGGMEFHNLGNYVIIEPFIEALRMEFPDADIATSIQMSDAFCRKNGITSLRDKRFWSYGSHTAARTVADIFRVCFWKMLQAIGLHPDALIRGSALLSELEQADLVIDFSGDLYGDNAAYNNFLESNARLIFSMLLNKPTVMLIGSPGPFTSMWRLLIARKIMGRLDLVTLREPVSQELLTFVGIKGDHIVSAACPSVLFRKDESKQAQQALEYEKLSPRSKPTVGLILCGWNMREGPYNKWPRADEEYEPFVKLIDHCITELGLRVCLMSHQNATDHALNLTRGNDHRIIDQLMSIFDKRYTEDQLFALKGLYTAASSKTIIGQLDMLISGRIHGAVQGLSQAVPTAIIDYGHEPKAHKLKGFARMYGVEEYLCNPLDAGHMIALVDRLWTNRASVRQMLLTRIPQVVDSAKENFTLTRMAYEKNR